ncbi:relaxase/mobilization nuclease domain-containing protein [Rhizobium sp. TRM95111]|uniref:relaxase/mobilization nuclease domain-containing protein n=1 Tax=Rhizobium alarense TaxID=2846851 RepID=UPI001F23C324|nr:relaxase/mobilization nuclease domain-containing protein [Rhizobium alarense]MCF3643136.1 relaxase/mobilization nuclease domain-containing protein [Rhizobium alarense]
MSIRLVDGSMPDWDDELEIRFKSARRGRNVRGGKVPAPKTNSQKPGLSGPSALAKVARTVRKAPEVMVKISGGGKNMQRIKAHFDYISRNGLVELEDENGLVLQGKEDVRDIRDAWAKGRIGIPYEGERRKEAFNIILSMPPGTDRQSVKDAARAFAAAQFPTHQYVFAAHDDEKHPHVHLVVKAADRHGVRLNPRKADLQQWRELFAEKMREQGIEANATPRKARGVVQKSELQAWRGMELRRPEDKRETPILKQAQLDAAWREAEGGPKLQNLAEKHIQERRKKVQRTYGEIAKALVRGGEQERALALEIVQFVRTMPPPQTRHERLVQQYREQPPADRPSKAKEPQERAQTRQPKDGQGRE